MMMTLVASGVTGTFCFFGDGGEEGVNSRTGL